MNTSKVSVIIPHLNTPWALEKCLDSVVNQSLDHGSFDVIVVDNGSKLPLTEVAARFPTVRFFSELKPGPGAARNKGVSETKATVLAFIDADCRAEAGWLQAAVDSVELSLADAVVGGDVLIDVVDPTRLSLLEAYESVFAYRQRHYIHQQGFSGTGNLAMSRAVFEQVGPFAGIELAEDIDWGRRACLAGFPASFNPNMIIYHPSRKSMSELQEKWRRHISHFYAAHQNAGLSALKWKMKAAAVLTSGIVHIPMVMFSSRVRGIRNRLLAIQALIEIRSWRSKEMLRVARQVSNAGAQSWNRT